MAHATSPSSYHTLKRVKNRVPHAKSGPSPEKLTRPESRAMFAEDNTENMERMSEEERRVVMHGSAEAIFDLGLKYHHGDGVQQDYLRPVKLYLGDRVARAMKKAVELHQLAAARGDAEARTTLGRMYSLGCTYYHGNGIPQNFIKAAVWFQRAFDNDDSSAMFVLGLMHYKGEGMAMDRPKGIQLITQAAGNGDEPAEDFLDDLEEDCASAEAMAEQLMQEEETAATQKAAATKTKGKKKKKGKRKQDSKTNNQVAPVTAPAEGATSPAVSALFPGKYKSVTILPSIQASDLVLCNQAFCSILQMKPPEQPLQQKTSSNSHLHSGNTCTTPALISKLTQVTCSSP